MRADLICTDSFQPNPLVLLASLTTGHPAGRAASGAPDAAAAAAAAKCSDAIMICTMSSMRCARRRAPRTKSEAIASAAGAAATARNASNPAAAPALAAAVALQRFDSVGGNLALSMSNPPLLVEQELSPAKDCRRCLSAAFSAANSFSWSCKASTHSFLRCRDAAADNLLRCFRRCLRASSGAQSSDKPSISASSSIPLCIVWFPPAAMS
mmetsp:Transcript_22676/g.47680  ORF Transcript_22676/g.47680 Transcript_22676/m.47680 type:complete len:211 (+) Transcript_22676:196-828(+)